MIVNYQAQEVLIGGPDMRGKSRNYFFSNEFDIAEERHTANECSANTNGDNTAIFFGLSVPEKLHFRPIQKEL